MSRCDLLERCAEPGDCCNVEGEKKKRKLFALPKLILFF